MSTATQDPGCPAGRFYHCRPFQTPGDPCPANQGWAGLENLLTSQRQRKTELLRKLNNQSSHAAGQELTGQQALLVNMESIKELGTPKGRCFPPAAMSHCSLRRGRNCQADQIFTSPRVEVEESTNFCCAIFLFMSPRRLQPVCSVICFVISIIGFHSNILSKSAPKSY